jgi:glucoamylase
MSPRSWDIWAPSVWAGSYWTASLQYRALRTGARLGRKIGRAESAPLFEAHASVILQYLQERDHLRHISII